jgi:fermentation-respiration switch protein FrsA (DUF1100 family)
MTLKGMRRLTWVLPLCLLVILGAYFATGWQMASRALVAKRRALEATPADYGLPFKEVVFSPRADRLTLRGWFIPAEKALGAVALVHGADSNRSAMLEIARGLWERGFHVLTFDLRAHGESEGATFTAGYREILDLLGALDYLWTVQGLPACSTGALGISLGGAVALLAAAREPRLRAVVSDASFARISDLVVRGAADRTGLSPRFASLLVPGMALIARLRYGVDLGEVVPERAVRNLPYPLLLIHTEGDPTVPLEHAFRLRAASPHAATEVWVVPSTEHARAYKTAPQEYIRRVGDYFLSRFSIECRGQQ